MRRSMPREIFALYLTGYTRGIRMRKLFNFLQYNNAVPIALFVIFGATGATFAASPEVREAVLSAEQVVQSVDNTYIVSADLASRDFGLVVTKIEEDEEYYY